MYKLHYDVEVGMGFTQPRALGCVNPIPTERGVVQLTCTHGSRL